MINYKSDTTGEVRRYRGWLSVLYTLPGMGILSMSGLVPMGDWLVVEYMGQMDRMEVRRTADGSVLEQTYLAHEYFSAVSIQS